VLLRFWRAGLPVRYWGPTRSLELHRKRGNRRDPKYFKKILHETSRYLIVVVQSPLLYRIGKSNKGFAAFRLRAQCSYQLSNVTAAICYYLFNHSNVEASVKYLAKNTSAIASFFSILHPIRLTLNAKQESCEYQLF